MLNKALAGVSALKGVDAVCVYHQQHMIASTFSAEQSVLLLPALQMIEQTFDAAEAINHPYEELYLILEEHMLVIYPLEQQYFILLLTDKKVNIPLIHLSIKALVGKSLDALKANTQAITLQSTNPQPSTPLTASTPIIKTNTETKPLRIDAEVQKQLNALKELLVHYLGPAGRWVFEDAVSEWQSNSSSINQLIPLLLSEFDSEQEKAQFQQRANALIHLP